MQKNVNKLFLSIILLNLFYMPITSGVGIYQFKASTSHQVSDVNSINWNEMEVGDIINIDQQVLDQFDNYTFVNKQEMYDLVEYDPAQNIYNVHTDSSRDRRTVIFEPEYQLNLNKSLSFGTRFTTDIESGVFANKGFVKLMTRPNYTRTDQSADWANHGTGENAWYLAADGNKLALKYREDGTYINTVSVPLSADINTFSLSISPSDKAASLSVCNLPASSQSYDCTSSQATEVYNLTSQISNTFLNNQFLSIAYSSGVQKENSTIHIEGISTTAYVESYGEIITNNPVVYVPLGTSAEEAHQIANPVYNEFIDNVITKINSPVPFSDLISDGGYNSNVAGKYLFTYSVTKGYDGGVASTGDVEVQVIDPNQIIAITGSPATVPVAYAPRNEQDLKSILKISATDPKSGSDVTDQVEVYNLGGYSLSNPQPGAYNIQFYIKDDSGHFIYDSQTLTITDSLSLDQLTVNQSISTDQNGDLKVGANETVTIDVEITNTTSNDLIDVNFEYLIDENHFIASTISNVTGDLDATDVNANKFSKLTTLSIGQSLAFSYQITARDTFIIQSQTQDPNNAANGLITTVYGTTDERILPLPVDKDFESSIETDFVVADSSNNNLLATDEAVSAVATLTNNSDYIINQTTFELEETAQKTELTEVEVTSNQRQLTAVDYRVENNLVTVDNVGKNEVLTVTYKGKAKSKFSNTNAAKFEINTVQYGTESTQIAASSELQAIEIDIQAISSLDIQTQITDKNNDQVTGGESFVVKFEISNNGTITDQQINVDIDTSDINIADQYQTINADMVEMTFRTDGVLSTGTYTVDNNEIIIDSLEPGQSATGTVHMQADWELDGSQFSTNPQDFAIQSAIEVNSTNGVSYNNQLELPIDTSSAYVNVNLNVRELTGDRDNKIDSGETFEFKTDVAIDGNTPLPGLVINYDLNSNNIAQITGIDYQVLLEGNDVTSDVVVNDTSLTIPNARHGQHYTIFANVTYGDPVGATYSSNSVTVSHPYISDIERTTNIEIDASNLRNIVIEAAASESVVSSGDLITISTTITNDGTTNENNLKLNLTGDSLNLDLTNIQDIVVTGSDYSVNGSEITINSLNAGQVVTVEFKIAVADVLTIDPNQGRETVFDLKLTGSLADGTTQVFDFEFSPQIDEVDYTTEFTVVPYIGQQAHANDYLVYTYKLTNNNQINLTNGTIELDIADQEIKQILAIDASSTDSSFYYTITDTGIEFDNLAVNQSVTVTTVVQTAEVFNQTPTIKAITNFNSDFSSQIDQVMINKDLQSESQIIVDSKLLATGSGNSLIGKNETVTYAVSVENSGKVGFNNLLIATDMLSPNFTDEQVLDITTIDGSSYDKYQLNEDDKILLTDFQPGEEIYITYQLSTNDNIEYDPDLNVTTKVSNELIDVSTVLPLSVDMEHVGTLTVNYYLEETASDSDGKLDPNEVNYINVIIENTDFIDYKDVIVTNTTDDQNLIVDFDNLTIRNQAGELLTSGTDYVKNGNKVYIADFPGDETYTFRYKISAKDTLTEANFATIEAEVEARYTGVDEDGDGLDDTYITPYQTKIPVDRASNMSYTASIDLENKNGSQLVSPGDDLTVQFEVVNTGKIDLTLVEATPQLQPNVDGQSIAIDFLDRDKATIKNNKLIINSVKSGETVTVGVNFKAASKFNVDDILTLNATVDSRLQSVAVTDSLIVDKSSASLNSNINYTSEEGDADNLADPNEVYYLDLELENNGDITLDDIKIELNELDSNISTISYVGSNVSFDQANSSIAKLNPGQVAKISYKVTLKSRFDSSNQIELGVTTSQADISDVLANATIDVDTVTNSQVTTSLVVTDDNDHLATANEQLTYSYELTNSGKRALSDVVLAIDVADRNLDQDSFTYQLTINGQPSTIELDSTNNTLTIPTLNSGDDVVLTYTVNTASEISSFNLFRTIFGLDIVINSSVSATDGDKLIADTQNADINVSSQVSSIEVTDQLIDSSNNNLLAANETYNYQVSVKNNGQIDNRDVVVRLSKSGLNAGALQTLKVTDSSGRVLTNGQEYTFADNTVNIKNLGVDQEYTINVEFKAPTTITAADIVTVKAVVEPVINNTQVVSKTIGADKGDRVITNQLSHELSGYSGQDLIGKQDTLYLEINNSGSVNENDVEVEIYDYSDDFHFDPNSIKVEKNGREYQDYTYDPITKIITLDEVNVGDQINISQNFYIDGDLDPTNHIAGDNYDVDINLDMSFTDGVSQKTNFEVLIPKQLISTIESDVKFNELIADDNMASGGEQLLGQITIENTNYLRQVGALIEVTGDSTTIDSESFEVVSVRDQDGQIVDQSRYSLTAQGIELKDFRHGEKWVIDYTVRTQSVFDFGKAPSIEEMRIDQIITITDDVNNSSKIYPTIKVSNDISNLKLTGNVADDSGNNRVSPGEHLTANYKMTNSGHLVEYNVPFILESRDSSLTGGHLDQAKLTYATGHQLVEGEDYEVDYDTKAVTIYKIEPGTVINIHLDYQMAQVMNDAKFVASTAKEVSNTNQVKRAYLFKPTDFTESKQFDASSHITDADNDGLSQPGEQLTYQLVITNNGDLNYMHVNGVVDLSMANATVDADSITFVRDGSVDSTIGYQLTDQALNFDAEHFDNGEQIKLLFTYTTPEQVAKSEIDTTLTTTSYNTTLSAEIRSGNPVTPEIEANYRPQITFNNIQLDEGTELNEDQLRALLNPIATDVEDGQVAVEIDSSQLDYQVPGHYQVKLSATDSGNKQTSAYADVVINDLKPSITTAERLKYIELGSENIDYVEFFDAVATEVNAGDLTDRISVHTEANLNVTGNYPLVFRVTDDEGNIATAIVSVVVVRDINDPEGNIDIGVDGNYPPVIVADDVVINEGSVVSNQQLIELANTAVSDPEDTDLTVVIEHQIDFEQPGQYPATITVYDRGGKSAAVTITVTVTDLLPQISADTNHAEVTVGTEIVDYSQLFGLNATEITNHDLSSVIEIDDREVDLNTTGSYSVVATVVDAERNQASLDLKLDVVRNLTENPDVTTPEVAPISPQVTGIEQASGNEETVLSDQQLINKFGVEYNSGYYLEFTVDQSQVDYYTPGIYPVVFTNTDTISGETATLVANYQVIDLLPTLTADDSLTIGRNEDLTGYLSTLNIVATEINSGDLNDYVIVDAEQVDMTTVGSYQLKLSVIDNEGNSSEIKVVTVDVVNSLLPVITSKDVNLTIDQANQITTPSELSAYTEVSARDYDGKQIDQLITIDSDDNFFANHGNYNLGDSYKIIYQVTNENGRIDTTTSNLTISDQADTVDMQSNSPVVFSVSEQPTLDDITARGHVRANLVIDGQSKTEYLTAADIVSSNYTPGQTGLFMIKYQYQGESLSATHNLLVFVSENGDVPDNKHIDIDPTINVEQIMPGQEFTESITITNNSVRTKTMSNIVFTSTDENISGINDVVVTDSNNNPVEINQQQIIQPRSGSNQVEIVDLMIPSGEQYTIEVLFETNQLFTYRKALATDYQVTFDGETRSGNVDTKVDPKAINVSATQTLDKTSYSGGDRGTINLTITNSGTMDTFYTLVTAESELTNIELTGYRIDGLVTEQGSKIMIPAQSSTVLEIDFKVNQLVVLGEDKLSFFDDLGDVIEIVIPVEYVVETTTDSSEQAQSSEQQTEEVSSEQTEEVSSEQSQDTTESKEHNSKVFSIMKTGQGSVLMISVVVLSGLILIRLRLRSNK